MQAIRTTQEVFSMLMNELEKRKFRFSIIDDNEGTFVAYNGNYSEVDIFIHGFRDTPKGVNLIIGSKCGNLISSVRNAIMCRYMEYFDINKQGSVELCISDELQADRNMADVANLLTRAYSLAVTSCA